MDQVQAKRTSLGDLTGEEEGEVSLVEPGGGSGDGEDVLVEVVREDGVESVGGVSGLLVVSVHDHSVLVHGETVLVCELLDLSGVRDVSSLDGETGSPGVEGDGVGEGALGVGVDDGSLEVLEAEVVLDERFLVASGVELLLDVDLLAVVLEGQVAALDGAQDGSVLEALSQVGGEFNAVAAVVIELQSEEVAVGEGLGEEVVLSSGSSLEVSHWKLRDRELVLFLFEFVYLIF